jgi:hypothetical protein
MFLKNLGKFNSQTKSSTMPAAKKSGYSASLIERKTEFMCIDSLKALPIALSARRSMYALRPRATLAAPTKEQIIDEL